LKTFSQYIEESIHYFDVDKTLMNTDATRVHVLDNKGNRVRSLDPQEFNHHKLEPGQKYDFSEFKSADAFNTAKPIRKMLAKLKAIHKNGGKAEILTARSDFDDPEKFSNKWKSYGVDISKGKVHVRRAGNLDLPTPEAKAKIVSDAIKRDGHTEVHLYDDHKPNIDAFLKLKQQHPNVKFYGHHVVHGEDGSVKLHKYKA